MSGSITLDSVGGKTFTLKEEAEFHIYGDGQDLYQYQQFRPEQYIGEAKKDAEKAGKPFLEYFNEKRAKTPRRIPLEPITEADVKSKDKLFKALKETFPYIHRLFNKLVEDDIKTNPYISFGDVVYQETDYESRQYYGLYIVMPDTNGDKYLYGYGDGGFYSKPNIIEFCKKVLEFNPDFFKKAGKEADNYIMRISGFRDYQIKEYKNEPSQAEEATKNVAAKSGGRRKTLRKSRKSKQTRKQNRN